MMGKAFASPRRLELLDLLAQAPRTRRRARARERPVERQHFAAPAGAARRRHGHPRSARARACATRIAGDEALALWLALRDASVARLAEVERAARDYLGEDVEAIGREELRRAPGAAATSSSSTCARARSSTPATSRARARSRSTSSSSASPSCPPTARSSPTAADPFCAYAHDAVRRLRAAGRRAPSASTTAGRNGGSPACPPRVEPLGSVLMSCCRHAGPIDVPAGGALGARRQRRAPRRVVAACHRRALRGTRARLQLPAGLQVADGRDRDRRRPSSASTAATSCCCVASTPGTYARWLLAEAQGGTFIDVGVRPRPEDRRGRASSTSSPGRRYFRTGSIESIAALRGRRAMRELPHEHDRAARRRRRPARGDPKTYTDVSTDQDQDFIFPTGRAWAEELGYPEPELSRVPDASVESFAGVANHWTARSHRARRDGPRSRLRRRHRPADRRPDGRPVRPRRSAST